VNQTNGHGGGVDGGKVGENAIFRAARQAGAAVDLKSKGIRAGEVSCWSNFNPVRGHYFFDGYPKAFGGGKTTRREWGRKYLDLQPFAVVLGGNRHALRDTAYG